ncbi:uncharacterized protein LOC8284158 isoform X2 [Ricinus communis]|uniref:uncharacterized protein LOC8284158 isoform X2 n=1 Tax=Ricinus communis TaxID=3988 RepID=UPI000D69454F|nr:uncharacterized protein LOC8284158 isoform X2 [Ricinus communis]|eukprot:XP_025013371.1 uncharacterized protein LOC8284158 isoform X2 [Ricinus communis]
MANTFYFPMVLYDTRLIPNFPALARNSQETLLYKRVCVSNSGLPFLHQCFTERRFSPRQRGLSLVPFNNDKSSEPREEDTPALETVLKLYTAIKNQNIHEVSNMIGDECRCVCNFFSSFESFQGKQQVLDFFNYVMQTLGNNIEFVVQPTKYDGMNVGVSWRLEWSKTHMPLGKGFSFYICQIYQGKVTIRNVEMFMEPLLHIEPFRLVSENNGKRHEHNGEDKLLL